MSYAEIEKLIEKAIAERFCTFRRIYNFVLQAADMVLTPDEVTEVLDGMILDRKIVKLENGVVTAYFSARKVPSKYWLDGDGKVAMEFNGQPKTIPDRVIQVGEIDKTQFNKYDGRKKTGKPARKYDLAEVERIASESKSQTEVAVRLGIHSNTLLKNKKEDPKFADALARGFAKRTVGVSRRSEIARNASVARWHSAAKSVADEIIEETETPQENEENIAKNITVADFSASDEVANQATQAKTAFAHQLQFKTGGRLTLTLSADLDIWQMDKTDREFIFSLVDSVKDYQNK